MTQRLNKAQIKNLDTICRLESKEKAARSKARDLRTKARLAEDLISSFIEDGDLSAAHEQIKARREMLDKIEYLENLASECHRVSVDLSF